MPECEHCGDAHATVSEATWVNESILLCPACWSDITSEPDFEIVMVTQRRGLRSTAKLKRWLIEKFGGDGW